MRVIESNRMNLALFQFSILCEIGDEKNTSISVKLVRGENIIGKRKIQKYLTKRCWRKGKLKEEYESGEVGEERNRRSCQSRAMHLPLTRLDRYTIFFSPQ